jgi:hypothetical protein
MLNQKKKLYWSNGANKISECGLQISDFESAAYQPFQFAFRNLKSAIDFASLLLKHFSTEVTI